MFVSFTFFGNYCQIVLYGESYYWKHNDDRCSLLFMLSDVALFISIIRNEI
jgi:hypothetical protein